MTIRFSGTYNVSNNYPIEFNDDAVNQEVTSQQIFWAIDDIAAIAEADKIDAAVEEIFEKLLAAPIVDLLGRNEDGDTPLHRAVKTGIPQIVFSLLSSPHGQKREVLKAENDGRDSALMIASEAGFLGAVEMLLEVGQRANAITTKELVLALHRAVQGKHVDVVNAFMVSMDGASDHRRGIVLKTAAEAGLFEVVEIFLEVGAFGNAITDKELVVILHRALQKNHLGAVNALITHMESACLESQMDMAIEKIQSARHLSRKGLHPLLRKQMGQIINIPVNEQTALMVAARVGNVDVVKVLLQAGAKLDLRDNFQCTALMYAAENGCLGVVNALRQAGANIDLFGHSGCTALISAAIRGDLDVVNTLLQAGASTDLIMNLGQSALMWAASRGHLAVVNALLQAGAKLDLGNSEGTTALMWAARNGHLAVVNVLLQAGAKLDLANNQWSFSAGTTALMWAALERRLGVMDALLQAGASIDQRDSRGQTALIRAADRGCLDVVDALLQAGAKLDLGDIEGNTALMWAAKSGHLAVVNALLQAGAKLDLGNDQDITTLMWAARNGHLAVVNALREAGAKLDLVDKRGYTALKWATVHWRLAVADVLRQAEANRALVDNSTVS